MSWFGVAGGVISTLGKGFGYIKAGRQAYNSPAGRRFRRYYRPYHPWVKRNVEQHVPYSRKVFKHFDRYGDAYAHAIDAGTNYQEYLQAGRMMYDRYRRYSPQTRQTRFYTPRYRRSYAPRRSGYYPRQPRQYSRRYYG